MDHSVTVGSISYIRICFPVFLDHDVLVVGYDDSNSEELIQALCQRQRAAQVQDTRFLSGTILESLQFAICAAPICPANNDQPNSPTRQ